jgi:hypothetical protein
LRHRRRCEDINKVVVKKNLLSVWVEFKSLKSVYFPWFNLQRIKISLKLIS